MNTGFGDNAGRAIFPSPVRGRARLSRNLLLSHTLGAGDHLPPDVVRASMLIRANTLVQGYSGVRREVIDTLVEMLNIAGCCPPCPPRIARRVRGLSRRWRTWRWCSARRSREDPHPLGQRRGVFPRRVMDARGRDGGDRRDDSACGARARKKE